MTPEETVPCDRCGNAVAPTRALVTGDLDDPEEVVYADCATPENRII